MSFSDFFRWVLRIKKEQLDFNSSFAMIQKTDSGINSFINDKFNKKINIYPSWDHYLSNSPMDSMEFTEVDVRNIKEVWKMPIISEEELNFDFMTTENFGEVTNRIRG